MQIVINTCFGGFGLSLEAQRRLVEEGCEHMKLYEPAVYYGNRTGWEKRFKEDQERGSASLLLLVIVNGKIVDDGHRSPDARTCPKLIQVVRELGVAANGWAAELRIVDIPEGVDFDIAEYDGRERIAESHRTWG